MKIAFIVGKIPTVSGTFIIDQIAGLLDRGVDVSIFSFNKPETLDNVSDKYFRYHMADRVRYLEMPTNRVERLVKAIPNIIRLLVHPRILFRLMKMKKFGSLNHAIELLYWVVPFANNKSDLFHIHFGTRANEFMTIREITGLKQKMVVTFYGYDASQVFKKYGDEVYDRLRKECRNFLVMSENMKGRLVEHGFEAKTITVHPVGIAMDAYPFKERTITENETVRILSVGRFVEKKGFDDLLKALNIVKDKTSRKIECTIVGDGPLNQEIHEMSDSLGLNDMVNFKGYMDIRSVVSLMRDMHFFIQPSKTAKNGDME